MVGVHVVVLIAVMTARQGVRVVMMTVHREVRAVMMTARHVVVLTAVMIVVRVLRAVMMIAHRVVVLIGIMIAVRVAVLIGIMTAHRVVVLTAVMIVVRAAVLIVTTTVARVVMMIAPLHNVVLLKCTSALVVVRRAEVCRIRLNVLAKTGLMRVLHDPPVVLSACAQRPLVARKKVGAKKYAHLMQ
jgi:hypothetical protein